MTKTKLPSFANSANLVVEDENEGEIELAQHEGELEFFDKIMRSTRQPIQRRMRAAEMRAQYKYPKLSAVATTRVDGSFADQLDRLIMQRTGKLLIEHHPDEGKCQDEGKSPAPPSQSLPPQAHWPIPRSAKSRRF
jgi:hypothetical protein